MIMWHRRSHIDVNSVPTVSIAHCRRSRLISTAWQLSWCQTSPYDCRMNHPLVPIGNRRIDHPTWPILRSWMDHPCDPFCGSRDVHALDYFWWSRTTQPRPLLRSRGSGCNDSWSGHLMRPKQCFFSLFCGFVLTNRSSLIYFPCVLLYKFQVDFPKLKLHSTTPPP